jgi:type I restriction enzyme S subunit
MMLVAPNHIESGTGKLTSRETAAEQAAISGKYLCQAGDVIYSKIRPALRKATLAPEECLCSADMYPLRARQGLDAAYLLFFLLSEPFSTWAVLESDRVAMPKINRETLNDLRLPVPPMSEQRAIVAHITTETAKLDALRAATERTITLLKERRAALIAAAVTGKINVQGETV